MSQKPVRVTKTVSSNAERARIKAKKHKQKVIRQWIMIGAAALAVIALILLLVLSGGKEDKVAPAATPAAQYTPDPTAVPTPAPTAQPVVYLPVLKKGPTNQRRIALTIDDCFQVDNLNTIIDMCAQLGCKITLFPIGDEIYKKPELQAALRRAHQMGFEIENHTFSHTKLYNKSDMEMAYQIYYQNMAVNMALGVDYEMHFMRLMGGLGENDLRTHQYLVQLNNLGLAQYRGIVNWAYSGSDATVKKSENELKNGMIYLFHTTNDDLKKLKEFIPYAVSQGYELVTLNELYGIDDNKCSPLKGDALSYEVPEPLPFVYTDYAVMDSRTSTQMYAVILVQERLKELGWLSAETEADGFYGTQSAEAVLRFQQAAGLTADGIAGPQTQAVLFSGSAPSNVPAAAARPEEAPQ